MDRILHIQSQLNAPPQTIFRALTNSAQLRAWFAEQADVSIPEGRYDFWGRYTPEAPDREAGRHPLLELEPDRRLKFGWRVRESESTVELILEPRPNGTLVILRQAGAPQSHDASVSTLEDFWFLSLENLRRHLDGKTGIVRCDYAAMQPGDIRHTVEIDGPRAAVFGVLIEPEQLERWIASQATVEPVAGGRYDFGWGVGPVKILELEPDEKLSYLWPEAEGDTIVTWTLEESEGKTRMTLVHSGFAPDKPTGGYNAGWLNFASWVKSIVEYGPEWMAPVIELPEGYAPFYAATIGARQAEIVFVPPRRAPGRLGTYVEVQTTVPDVADALGFYLRLGFEPLGDNLLTDGNLNIRLLEGGGSGPTLAYYGGEPASFTDPNGLQVKAFAGDARLPAAAGRSLGGPPRARCGKFGEFALPCRDLPGSIAFWRQFGFQATHVEAQPYPWAILVDGLMVLGLHQTTDFTQPHLTYFARDMADRLEQLLNDGLSLKSFDPEIDDRLTNAVLTAPGGQKFFLFTGDI